MNAVGLGRTWLACAGLVLAAGAAHATEGVRLPPVQRAALANGAELALVEKRDTPLVSMTITIRGGALGDAPGREGTASLFADLIQKGAGRRDAAQFAEAVESAGGALAVAADSERLQLSASFLARDVDLMLELASDALVRPTLAAEEFEKSRTLAIQSIAAAKDSDPRMLIGSYGDAWLFRGHPYGRPVDGSEASLEAVTLEDVREYHAAHVGGDRLIVAVVGDVDARAMRAKLERAFGGWRKAAGPVPGLAAPERVTGRRVLLVDDVRNTGQTFARCAELVRASGGTLIATAEIYDRMEALVDAGVPNVPLAEYRAPDNHPAAECPLCAQGVPITTF